MKFDSIDWKILAFKVGRIFFLTLFYNFKWLWLPFVESFCTIDFELKFFYVEELRW